LEADQLAGSQYAFGISAASQIDQFTWKLISWPEVGTRPELLQPAKSIAISLGRRAYAELTRRFHIALRCSCAALPISFPSTIPLKPSLPPLYKCRHNAAFNPLTPELNPSALRCLTRFLLGILLLEPCISLMYA
jgi:hypothetical protein